MLPSDPKERKTHPITTGVLDYFPNAIAAVAHCSFVGNEQHNPGTPLHWDRSKSQDEADALTRHLLQRGTVDSDGVRHSAKVAWRALAMLEKEIEAEQPSKDYYSPEAKAALQQQLNNIEVRPRTAALDCQCPGCQPYRSKKA